MRIHFREVSIANKKLYTELITAQQVLSGNETLEFANGAFLNEGYQVKSGFRKVLEEDFLSSVEIVQFANSRAAAGEINSWVSDHTHGKIQNLVSPGKGTSQYSVKCTSVNECMFF
jgi:serine protease inhibitor